MNDQYTTIQFLKDSIVNFNAARDWGQWHKPRNLAQSICIEAAELLECYQWDFDWPGQQAIEEELADILIYCLSFANVCEIDVSAAVLDKLRKNGEKYPLDTEQTSC